MIVQIKLPGIENGIRSRVKNGKQKYQILKKEFPKIWRADMYGRTIFYLEDRFDIAMRMFLERIDRKIISYQELKQIIDIFQGNISKKDKKKYIKKDEN